MNKTWYCILILKSITMRIIFGFPISLGGRQHSPTFTLAGFRRNGNDIYHQHHNPKNIYIQKVMRGDLIYGLKSYSFFFFLISSLKS
jgi:hypothetical protein